MYFYWVFGGHRCHERSSHGHLSNFGYSLAFSLIYIILPPHIDLGFSLFLTIYYIYLDGFENWTYIWLILIQTTL